jgi:RNA polymerase sigma-70 factor (ECF subfamily)
MRDHTVDEEALMAAYSEGDGEAFNELFSSLGPRIHGFFLRRFGNDAVADDLLQTTFLKVHRARAEYRIGAPVRPWVFTIAARVGLDEYRRRGRRPEMTDDQSMERATSAVAMERAAKTDLAERADIAAHVRSALEILPDSQREVVMLHRYEGFTFAEIGKMLGLSEGAAKLRAFRAYERLRERLAPLVEEAGGVAVAEG